MAYASELAVSGPLDLDIGFDESDDSDESGGAEIVSWPRDDYADPESGKVLIRPEILPLTRQIWAINNDFSAPEELRDLNYLVIDENRFGRALLRNALFAYGMSGVVEVDNAAEGLERLAGGDIDVIIADYNIPDDGGIAFTLQVRRGGNVPNPELPIIMVSGNADEEMVVEARNAGVHEFIGRPNSPASLYRRLRATILNPRPFIVAENYVGPDRRWLNTGASDGIERRHQTRETPSTSVDVTRAAPDLMARLNAGRLLPRTE